jgi:hypothetical protein
MLSLWMRWLFGLTLAATVVGSGGAQVASEPSVKAIEELIARAQQTAGPRATETDVSEQARRTFVIGEKSQTYDATMRSLRFEKHINQFQGERVVIFSRTDASAQPIGNKELRIVLTTDPDDRIKSVLAQIFFHTI